MKKIILAIVGLPGSGKNNATNYIVKKTGWPKVYFGQSVLDAVGERGLPITEANERMVREDLRKELGMAALAKLNLPQIEEFFASSSVILESFYSWEEYLFIKEKFDGSFKVLALFASPTIRSDRVAARAHRPLTEQEFISRDYSQIENLHQAGPIARADFMVINEGTEQELHSQIDKVLEQL